MSEFSRGTVRTQKAPFYYWGHGKAVSDKYGQLVERTETRPGGVRLVTQDGHNIEFGSATKFWTSPAYVHEEVRHMSDGDSIAVIYYAREDGCGCDTPPAPGHAHEGYCALSDEDENAGVQEHLDSAAASSDRLEASKSRKHVAGMGKLRPLPCGQKQCKVCSDALLTCWCGCGAATTGGPRRFVQGHDARKMKWFVVQALVEAGISESQARILVRRRSVEIGVWGDHAANSIREGSERYGERSYHMANVPAEHFTFRREQARMVAGMFPELA